MFNLFMLLMLFLCTISSKSLYASNKYSDLNDLPYELKSSFSMMDSMPIHVVIDTSYAKKILGNYNHVYLREREEIRLTGTVNILKRSVVLVRAYKENAVNTFNPIVAKLANNNLLLFSYCSCKDFSEDSVNEVYAVIFLERDPINIFAKIIPMDMPKGIPLK